MDNAQMRRLDAAMLERGQRTIKQPCRDGLVETRHHDAKAASVQFTCI